MKKKVFSKLLMVALVATVGAFTSCKDYDDDINDLRSRIDGLNTSLNTTVANKITAVESSIDLLSKQLSEVKADYAKADEALKTALQASIDNVADKANAADSKATVNASDILKLQGEVVTLKSADANLQAAIDKLEAALKDANATLKTQGETLIGLAKADEALEKGINEAKAQADNALTEAKKAQEAAATNAANLKSTDATLAALQNTVAENLKTVNSKIDSEIAKLDTRIKTNETNIAALQTASAKAEANIVTINAKLEELARKDNEISTKLDTELGKLAESLNTNVADLKTMINNAKSDLTAKIGEEATIRAKAISDLSDRVTANETAIAFIQEETIPQLIKNLREHLVPEYVTAEVAKQLPAALEVFMNDEVMPYVEDIVATETGKNKTLIDALTDKVKQDSIDLAAYTDAQFLLTAGLLAIYYDLDAEDLGDVPASALANAIAAGDSILQDNIDAVADALADEKDADKAGSLAALIAQIKNEADATSIAGKLKKLTNDFNDATNEAKAGSLANRFKTIEDFFAPAADDAEASDISVANLAAKIAETKSFTDAVNKAAADANGEILDMITAINLFANQHHAQADEYGKVKYTDGKTEKYPFGWGNFDHELNFVFTVEQGIYASAEDAIKLVDPQVGTAVWNYPHDYVNKPEIDNAYNYTPSKAVAEGEEDVDYYQFKHGRFRSYEDSILVRVSPTNADLRKAKIALLNSKGEDIIDAGLVELYEVKKYTSDDYITRAASGNETGLWVIKFKLNEANVGDLWLKYSEYNGNAIVYAVAVKNTGISVDEEGNSKSEGVERYVASEYDLSLAVTEAKHGYTFDVNNVNIEKIHNRYIQTEEAQIGGSRWTDDKETYSESFAYELTWKAPCTPDETTESEDDDTELTPTHWWYEFCCDCNFGPEGQYNADCYERNDKTGKFIGTNETGFTSVFFDKTRDGYEENKPDPYCYADINAIDRIGHDISSTGKRETSGIDNRHLQPFLPIQFTETLPGEEGKWAKIEIEFPTTNSCGELTPIKGFFVTLDQQFGDESGNSEINAWWNYIYKNVAKFSWNWSTPIVEKITLQKGNKGVIYIKDDNNIDNGDVIGFRVHAVNYDGTLTDPDGRAFYVEIGKESVTKELSFDITVTTSDPEKDSAWAVQNLVDGENPIVAYNNAMKEDGLDKRFFNRDPYKGSYIPNQTYQIVYTWREDNPAIKSKDNLYACIPVAGTGHDGTQTENAKNHADAKVVANGKLVSVIDETRRPNYDVEEFFDFRFSENGNADINDKTDGVDNFWAKYNEEYTSNGKDKVAANRLTQSVKATIRPAAVQRLIDGETYKITATILRYDGQTDWRTVDVIDIDITKNMPTTLPREFRVKSNQLTNGQWPFLLRPLGSEATGKETTDVASTVWQIGTADDNFVWGRSEKDTYEKNLGEDKSWNGTEYVDVTTSRQNYRWGVDARPYTFEEIFLGVTYDINNANGAFDHSEVDKDYYFVFKGAGDYAKATNAADTKFTTKIARDKEYGDDDAYAVYDETYTATNVNDGGTLSVGAYKMPYIYYGMLGKTANVEAGYIYRDISAKLDKNGSRFLNPNAQDKELMSLKIKNGDYQLASQQVKVGTNDLVANFNCVFENALVTYPKSATQAAGKKTNEYANTCVKDIKYGEDGTLNLDSMVIRFTDQNKYDPSKNDTKGYFNASLVAGWDTNQLWDTSSEKDKEQKGNVLTTLITEGYLWINVWEAPRVTGLNPASYIFSDYYYAFWADAAGNKLEGDQLKPWNVAKIGIERKHRTGQLPALETDVTGFVTFKVYDIWNHALPNDVKLYFKLVKPEHQGARRQR